MRYLVVLLLGLLVLPVQASMKVDIFGAEIVLDENEPEAEKLAREEGLKQVILRASADKNALENPVVKKALTRSGQYLSQIGYGDQFEQKTLQMVFNPAQIQALLAQAELPYWSNIRSNLVVWVIQEGEYGREIVWEYSGDSNLNQIKFLADARGLPITLPIGDIEDITNISGPDLWGGFTTPISQASLRYTPDAVLVIRIQRAADGHYVRWTLYDEKPEYMVDSKRDPIVGFASGDTPVALEKVIDDVSGYYARRSSTKSSGISENSVNVTFIEVSNARQFFALESLLKGLNSVAGIDVTAIKGNEISVEVHLLSTVDDFSTEVVQNESVRRFELAESPVTQSDDNNVALQDGVNSSSSLPTTVDGIPAQTGENGEFTNPTIEEIPSQSLKPKPFAPLVFEWID